MRTFVISDIHGNNETFRKALKSVHLKKTDKLILLGDYIDRGYDSKGVLDTILLLRQHNFNVVCLRGNHEQMLLDALNDLNSLNQWMQNGGGETLSSFLVGSISKIPQSYIDLIESFKYYYEDGKFIFVHAALNMHIEDPFQDKQTILWSRSQGDLLDINWLDSRKVIHGHNPTTRQNIEVSIIRDQSIICLDNGIFIQREGYGHLCVLELNTMATSFIK